MPSGNPRLQVFLDRLLYTGLQARAIARHVTINQLAISVLGEYVKAAAEEEGGIPVLLRHLDTLVRSLQTQANQLALKQIAALGPGPVKQPMMADKDTQADRLRLHDTVDTILKTVIKLCENEEAAANAKARMQAMRLANTTIRSDLALLQGYDRRDIELLIDEVRATNESLKAQLAASGKGTKRT